MNPITVMLAEDHAVVREGFRRILELDKGIKVVAEAEDGAKAIVLVKTLRPSVVLMDIAMPNLNGLEATRQIMKVLPATRIMILSAHSDEAYIDKAVECGAVGFLLKQTSASDVVRAIYQVAEGKTWFERARTAGDHRTRDATAMRKPREPLSPRESEVLQLVAEGKANKEMAATMGIAIKTVEKHREHLMRKLGIHDTAGLTRYAIGAGVIESNIQVTIIQPRAPRI